MPLLNWPPSKGPLPPHLKVVKSEAYLGVKRRDFQFKQPPQAAAERRHLLEAVMDLHGDPKTEEKVGMDFRIPGGKADREILLDHPVAVVSRMEFDEAHFAVHGVGANSGALIGNLPLRRYDIPLTYPLTVGVELRVDPFELTRTMGDGKKIHDSRMSVGYLLWVVASEYKKVYANWRKYKPWGHGIEDLTFRVMVIHRGSPNPWIELEFAS